MKDVALVPLYFAHDAWATGGEYELVKDSRGLLMANNLRLRAKK